MPEISSTVTGHKFVFQHSSLPAPPSGLLSCLARAVILPCTVFTPSCAAFLSGCRRAKPWTEHSSQRLSLSCLPCPMHHIPAPCTATFTHTPPAPFPTFAHTLFIPPHARFLLTGPQREQPWLQLKGSVGPPPHAAQQQEPPLPPCALPPPMLVSDKTSLAPIQAFQVTLDHLYSSSSNLLLISSQYAPSQYAHNTCSAQSISLSTHTMAAAA